MASGGDNKSIHISAGGNVSIGGAVAIGENASAQVVILHEADRSKLFEYFGRLQTLVANDDDIAVQDKAVLNEKISGVSKLLAAPDAPADTVKKESRGVIDFINGLCIDLKRKAGLFQCLDTIIGVLGFATGLLNLNS